MSEKKTKKEILESILADIEDVGSVDGSIILSREGLLIVSRVSSGVDDKILAALFSSATAATETAMTEIKLGRVGRLIVSAAMGQVALMPAGHSAILATLIKRDAPNLGLILTEMGKKVKEISDVIG